MTTRTQDYRRALVTGASSGIGAAFAERLAADGTDLVVVARSSERLMTLAGRLRSTHGVDVAVESADLTDASACRRIEALVADDPRLDLLVNNAGFGTLGTFATLDADEEEREIHLNVLALVRLTRAALAGMSARGRGTIINVSSMAALQPAPYNATYGATKAFVNSFTEALIEEMRGSSVHLQVLCPGFTRTEFQQRAGLDASQVPDFAWMTAEAVVAASLRAARAGSSVCVPGIGNRVLSTLTGITPRWLLMRAIGASAKRLIARD